MNPTVREILEFCNDHARAANALKHDKESDMERMVRLAEEAAYKNVADFITSSK